VRDNISFIDDVKPLATKLRLDATQYVPPRCQRGCDEEIVITGPLPTAFVGSPGAAFFWLHGYEAHKIEQERSEG